MAAASGPDLAALNASFRRTLRAQNKSDRTVEAYTDAVRLLAEFCAAGGHPLPVRELKCRHVELFIADQLARWKPATANNRYRGLRSFFAWAVAEGELDVSPMAGIRPPQIPETPVPVLGEEQLRRLLKACEGRDFPARRDTAIIRLLIDTGPRRGECAVGMVCRVARDQRRARPDHHQWSRRRPGGPARPAGQDPRPRPAAALGTPSPLRPARDLKAGGPHTGRKMQAAHQHRRRVPANHQPIPANKPPHRKREP
jgi:hypothetical protein